MGFKQSETFTKNGVIFAALFHSVFFTFYVVLQCDYRLEKSPKLENFRRWSVTGVRIRKSRPLESARLANQIQGFTEIPVR